MKHAYACLLLAVGLAVGGPATAQEVTANGCESVTEPLVDGQTPTLQELMLRVFGREFISLSAIVQAPALFAPPAAAFARAAARVAFWAQIAA